MAVSWDKFSSKLDKMAPQLCPFEISNFDTFSTTPPKHVWALWDHRPDKRKSSFFHFLLVSFDESTIDHFPFIRPVVPNALASDKGTNGRPPNGSNQLSFDRLDLIVWIQTSGANQSDPTSYPFYFKRYIL